LKGGENEKPYFKRAKTEDLEEFFSEEERASGQTDPSSKCK